MHNKGTGNRRVLSWAYVSVTMLHSATLGSAGSPNRSRQPDANITRSEPQRELRTQCSLLLHTAGLHTHRLTRANSCQQGGMGGLGGDRGSRRQDRATPTPLLRTSPPPPPQCWSRDKSWPAHSSAQQSRSHSTGFCCSLEHLILLTVTEVTALRRRTHY